MTPDIESVLDEIGWQTAKRCSYLLLARWTLALSPTGGKLGKKPQDAKKLARAVDGIFREMHDLAQRLDALPDGVRRSINLAATSKQEMLNRVRGSAEMPPDFIGEFRASFLSLAPGMEDTLARLERESGPQQKGRPRNEAAYTVAATIAEIFTVGMGEVPTIGRREDGGGLSGPFGRAVEKVLALLEIKVADAHAPCSKAVASLKVGQRDLLLGLRCPVTRDLVEFDFQMEKMPSER